MYPKLFTIPGIDFTLHSFGLMVLIGAMAGMTFAKYEAKRRGLDEEEIVSIAIEIFLAGLLGTRLLFVMQNWDFFEDKGWFSLINLREGGLVWFGGPLFALPVIYFRLRNYKVNPFLITDIWAPGLVFGHSFGRIGCFLAGDDYGIKWHETTWFTVTFNNPDALLPDDFRGVPLLPAQPLMWFGLVVIFLILLSIRKKIAHKPGTIPALYFALYSVHRSLIELIRGDADRGIYDVPLLGELSMSMILSMIVFPCGMAVFVWLMRRPDYVGEGYVDWEHGPARLLALRPAEEARRAEAARKAEEAEEAKAGGSKPKAAKPKAANPEAAKPDETEPDMAEPQPDPEGSQPDSPDDATEAS